MSNNANNVLDGTRSASCYSLSSSEPKPTFFSSCRSTSLLRTKRESRAKNQKKNEKRRISVRYVGRRPLDVREAKEGRSALVSKSNYLFPTRCDIGTVDRKTRGSPDGSQCPRAGGGHGLLRIRPKLMAE